MRYLIAFVIACVIVGGGVAFCANVRQSLIQQLREQIQNAEHADAKVAEWEEMLNQGKIPPELGIEVSPSMLWRITIADLLAGFWYILVHLDHDRIRCILCYGPFCSSSVT